MMTIIPSFLTGMLHSVFSYLVERLLWLALFLWVAYTLGWFHRFLKWTLEREASKLLNGTTVTLGSLRTDLVRGQGWASNVVLHSPQQEAWQWEAPVLARVGRVYVEVNVVQCLFFLWFYQQEIPLELYTVHLSDIQVFVERKHMIYNFFLLDPHVIAPNPRTRDGATTHNNKQQQQKHDETDNAAAVNNRNTTSEQGKGGPTTIATSGSSLSSPHTKQAGGSSSDALNNHHPTDDRAQQVVDDMLTAVRRAAQDGDHGALWTHYRHTLTNQLKQFQQENKQGKTKSQAVQEGVHLIQRVTASITETAATAQQVVLPARRKLPGDEQPVLGRVGRIVLEDLHIFLMGGGGGGCGSSSDNKSNNKPICIQKVAIRASEFCPPLSAKDPGCPDRPALYLPLDACLEVVWKRVLAKMAKRNTGRFFQTAIGEAADVFFSKNNSSSSSSNNNKTKTATSMPTYSLSKD